LFASWGLYNDWPRMCTIIPQSMDSFRASLGLKAEIVDLRSSGDTAGDKNRVVGYGAYAFSTQGRL
ncbi:MAG: AmmeMemoRadiSam system protein B, partial [Candidatus Thiodiazotropha sp. (ex Gloverina cf. vestifex)]|nr:AmmeMemoRadiSam system protein B [Candidatus Thiodiazotropha sp. (ex Gloverina cf. vestifex)]